MPENHQVDVGFVQATLSDLVLPMGLKVDTVKISAQGLHVESEPFLASLTQPGTFEVFVGEQSLAEFMQKKAPSKLRNLSVDARDGKLHVKAGVVMFLELPANAICTLRIVQNRFLYVDLESVNVMGAGATSLVQSQIDAVNPVLDVEDFPVRATLNQVDIFEGGVLLLGTVAPP